MRSTNGTRIWNPAWIVRLYRPRFSTTYALCWGTTVAVLAITMITSTEITMKTYSVSIENLSPLRLSGFQMQDEPVGVADHGLAARRDRRDIDVSRGPAGAVILDAAGLPRLQLDGNDDAIAGGNAITHFPDAPFDDCVHALPERDDRE